MIVLVDTNVLLDVLAERKPFYEAAFAVWSLAEQKHLQAHVSAISFNNLHYVLARLADPRKARRAMRMLREVFSVVPLDERILHQAIDADIRDFEDAIQFFSALRAGAACLLTRDTGHFPTGDIAIQTPAEFLAAHFSKR